MSQLRRTQYHSCPSQTQSAGIQTLSLPIDRLFYQGCLRKLSEGIRELISGEHYDSARIAALLRKFGLDLPKILKLSLIHI